MGTALPHPAPPVPDPPGVMPPARKALHGDSLLWGLLWIYTGRCSLRGPVLAVPAKNCASTLEQLESTGELLLVPLRRESPWRRLLSESNLGQLWRKLRNFGTPAAHPTSGTAALPAWDWFVGTLCLLPFILCVLTVSETCKTWGQLPRPRCLVPGCPNTLSVV